MGGTGNRIFFMCSSKNLSTLTVSSLLVILDSGSVEGFGLAFFRGCVLVLKFCKNDASRKKKSISHALIPEQCLIYCYILYKIHVLHLFAKQYICIHSMGIDFHALATVFPATDVTFQYCYICFSLHKGHK